MVSSSRLAVLAQNFNDEMRFDRFELEVIASEGKMSVTLNNNESMVFEDIHMERWGVFENYFKAGNHLGTRDKGAFAKVKYYTLSVSH